MKALLALALFFFARSLAGEAFPFPACLSETHLFPSFEPLTVADDLVPYQINRAFWSDGAAKKRWMRLPRGRLIRFHETGAWVFPAGTLFVKHFELNGKPIETRLLLVNATNVTGASYRWRANSRDADLLATNCLENFTSGHSWYFPSREDCRVCHNAAAGLVLGVNTRQMNHAGQLAEWSRRGLLDRKITEQEAAGLLALPDDLSASAPLELQARAYLDVNCAFCHRPGGVVANFDARYDTPLERQQIINGTVLFDQGIDHARVISPHDPWRSILLLRMQTLEGFKMPPLAHQRVDDAGVTMIRRWIASLKGPEVLPPPEIGLQDGKVRLADPGREVEIHYTTDGLPPGKNSPVYSGPLEIPFPATVRARAYREGFTKSIAVQRTFTGE